ncbi:PilW family protein [Spongiibacter sp. KMU-158]|uniref:PilW family protein n=1 Tax=Spongiibacter pelagi TaxID=2760804 RepID=A0A927C235_9GAMM|nr:PilW family protein [Spongiibacter pelagi]MBD2859875.1 PilW family protein [Spongiibacter pelagi]
MKKLRGFSLIELMIAMTLGILLSLAVSQVLLGSRASDNVQEALSQIQENARFAMSYIGKEVRMAGFIGCATISSTSVNNIALPADEVDFSDATALIVDNDVDADNDFDAVAGTDILHLKRGSDEFIRISGAIAPSSAQIQVENNSVGFEQGDFVLVSDCESADVFRITSEPAGAGEGTATLAHAAGATNSSGTLSRLYSADAELYGLEELHFFIQDSGKTTNRGGAINSLYVSQRRIGSGGPLSAATELLEGVEDMQIELGVDTNDDQQIDQYVDADAVADWADVLSLKLRLQLYSTNSAAVNGSGQTFTNAVGEEVEVDDGRMRRVFINVFAIRNKLP